MLISFSVKNFLSFDDEITFSMVANGRDQHHSERIAYIEKYEKKILPISMLFGGNASGKSNFVEAVDFARSYIIEGIKKDDKIPLKTFKLNSKKSKEPSKFVFQFLLDENIYEYGFEVTTEEVIKEWLLIFGKTTERIIFDRERNYFKFDYSAWGIKNDSNKKYLYYLAESTLTNKLFLSNINDIKIDKQKELDLILSIYKLFNNITIIRPEASFRFMKRHILSKEMISFINTLLNKLDTGVSEFEIKEYPIPKSSIEDSNGNIDFEKLLHLNVDPRSIQLEKEDDKYIVLKKTTKHLDDKKNPVNFSLHEESDGTERLIDLVPAFYYLLYGGAEQVFVIDEFNRSLHPLLTRKLLEAYLASCNENTRTQLIITTHDVMLLDQDIFRRDEIWFIERNKFGASELSSLSDFKNIRKDKKLRNDYLMGRFDGIPNLLPFSDFIISNKDDLK